MSSISSTSSYYNSYSTNMYQARQRQQPSAEDIEAKKAERFSNTDTDTDGSISISEFETMLENMAQDRPELPEGVEAPSDMPSAEELFAEYDADGDGAISEEEFSAGEDAMHEKMGNMPPPPPPPSGGMGAMGSTSSSVGGTDTFLQMLLNSQSSDESSDESSDTITANQLKELLSSLKGLSAYLGTNSYNADSYLSLSSIQA